MTDIKIETPGKPLLVLVKTSTVQPPVLPVQTAPPPAADSNASKQPPAPTLDKSEEPQAVVLTQEQRVARLLEERYVCVTPMADASFFTHRGHCSKCGWQTLQHNETAAHDLVMQHAWQHWRDVAPVAQAEAAAQAPAPTGAA